RRIFRKNLDIQGAYHLAIKISLVKQKYYTKTKNSCATSTFGGSPVKCSATESDAGNAWNWYMDYSGANVSRYNNYGKNRPHSIRCLLD
ncbi:MAG: hypothetical protein LBU89_14580, partial [Fibromonadaceae bacterium]|nr:hypothetical protein [Fibromonadaceae bacterium]